MIILVKRQKYIQQQNGPINLAKFKGKAIEEKLQNMKEKGK